MIDPSVLDTAFYQVLDAQKHCRDTGICIDEYADKYFNRRCGYYPTSPKLEKWNSQYRAEWRKFLDYSCEYKKLSVEFRTLYTLLYENPTSALDTLHAQRLLAKMRELDWLTRDLLPDTDGDPK